MVSIAARKQRSQIISLPMAIENELSSEIAIAILTAEAQTTARLYELKKIVLKVHATLQEMSEKERDHRIAELSRRLRK